MGFADYSQYQQKLSSEMTFLNKQMTARCAEEYHSENGSLRTSYSPDKSITIFSNDNDNNGIYESAYTMEQTPEGGVRTIGYEKFYNDTGNVQERTLYGEDGVSSKTMYDENGNVTKVEVYDESGNSKEYQYEYYNDGSLKSTTTVGADGKKETIYEDSFLTRLFKH